VKLSTTYEVISGDSLEIIARKVYGSELEADNIRRANSGVTEPLTTGTSLTIPPLAGAPTNRPSSAPSDNINEVALSIDGDRFRFWENIRISLSIDKFSTIDFSAPFEHTAAGFKERFSPLSYKPTQILVEGEPLFTGTILPVSPVLAPGKKTVSVSAYATPGVLGDCPSPANAFPLEFNGQNLTEIATTLAKPFGVDVAIVGSAGANFARVNQKTGDKVLSFLTGLAKQRGLLITDDALGKLLIWTAKTTAPPVAILKQGESPLISVTPTIAPQQFYSHITGIEPTRSGSTGSKFTVKNPHLNGVVRPFSFTVSDTKNSDLKQAVNAKMGRMFGDAVSYSVAVSTWRTPAGKLWGKGDIIELTAPDAMVYSPYKFIIRDIELNKTSTTESAVLTVTLPEAYSGEIPEVMPWDL